MMRRGPGGPPIFLPYLVVFLSLAAGLPYVMENIEHTTFLCPVLSLGSPTSPGRVADLAGCGSGAAIGARPGDRAGLCLPGRAEPGPWEAGMIRLSPKQARPPAGNTGIRAGEGKKGSGLANQWC